MKVELTTDDLVLSKVKVAFDRNPGRVRRMSSQCFALSFSLSPRSLFAHAHQKDNTVTQVRQWPIFKLESTISSCWEIKQRWQSVQLITWLVLAFASAEKDLGVQADTLPLANLVVQKTTSLACPHSKERYHTIRCLRTTQKPS